MRMYSVTLNSQLVKSSIMLALIFFALFTLKVTLASCSFWGQVDCIKADLTAVQLIDELSKLKTEIDDLKQSINDIDCQISKDQSDTKNAVINIPAWRAGKIEALYGCWSLDWNYTMQEVKTKKVVGVKFWDICFNSGENIGSQTLEFQDDVSCSKQQILGKFEKNNSGLQTLLLDDTNDLRCTNNVTVLRRKLNCVLAENGSHAMCSQTTRDENGNWSPVRENTVRLSRK